MSMSQEEIEALMNGLDIVEDKSEPEAVEIEEPVKVDTKEIEELISQTKTRIKAFSALSTLNKLSEPFIFKMALLKP